MLNYDLKQIEIVIGTERLKLECIRDLNQTIDVLFADHEKTGNSEALEDLCPYFGVIWASARALAQTLFEEREQIKGKTILEVGCGLALPSLICAKLGAHVTATDFHPEVPQFLERNIALNELRLNYVHHDWKNSEKPLGQFDWVIGSDILYERQHPEPVARALASHCKPDGTVFLADPARPYLQNFLDEMKRIGWNEETRVLTVPDEPTPKDIFLLRFSKQPTSHG